ncbi:cation diffusion facilitator CzcD-associated flavoprotein CzcO [Saccharomonospora amisosensis]|uniref:Cation diffusion facilitator CzcD-associated flavoprotein CzcO n=1 Tax=Saccharomonospora amisosensis TaxID=1128677 RepID=A0A7X5UMM0_9PSEU|nr:NAD(P)/FAD-dependent oxidoreductase [Saccharomonospora amisosensis]NIJ10815.1 cation diffusion facilitator CzcD-associated flavoprotein CzcO [Saccharomonospora amisosensis]
MSTPVAVIGAGPSGLAAARNLRRYGHAYTGYELSGDVGGLWNIDNPRSTVYESAHLISSRTTTEFAEFPMADTVADYPSHRELLTYFRDFADTFGLREDYRFNTEVTRVEPDGDSWAVTSTGPDGTRTQRHASVLIACGTLSEPAIPTFRGSFDGELFHTCRYKRAKIFEGKRVLIVGAGNSGCDIAVDAVHHADSVDISVRRGYYFVPKYLFGRPADTLNQGRPLPPRLKQAIDSRLLKLFTGDPVRFGFPKPDYKIYESHPVVNSLVLHHIGHGDIRVRRDIERLDGDGVRFTDGERGSYDTIVLATGYHLHYPFVEPKLLNWAGPGSGTAPDLYLNIFPESAPGLFVLGMVEASGLGWQGRYEQAELVAAYLAARERAPGRAAELEARMRGPRPDLTGGYRYLGLERMSYYVNKDAYRRAVRDELARLDVAP